MSHKCDCDPCQCKDPSPKKTDSKSSKIKKTILKLTAIKLATMLAVLFAIKSPELHSLYIRSKVGSKVYIIRAKEGQGGGGTGFSIEAPSGNSYVVTNAHVCEYVLSQTDTPGHVVVESHGSSIKRRVIEISDKSDLCLIEGLPGVSGLSLGSEPSLGETLTVVGHPNLRPLSLSKGEMVGKTDVSTMNFAYPSGNAFIDSWLGAKDGKCDLPKNEIRELEIRDLAGNVIKLKVCLTTITNAYSSTVVIFPGNSGSPTVDFLGNVVGVAFAADHTNWAAIVSIRDLLRFLNKY